MFLKIYTSAARIFLNVCLHKCLLTHLSSLFKLLETAAPFPREEVSSSCWVSLLLHKFFIPQLMAVTTRRAISPTTLRVKSNIIHSLLTKSQRQSYIKCSIIIIYNNPAFPRLVRVGGCGRSCCFHCSCFWWVIFMFPLSRFGYILFLTANEPLTRIWLQNVICII